MNGIKCEVRKLRCGLMQSRENLNANAVSISITLSDGVESNN